MTVGQIFTKIGNFIENRQIFILLNCNCARLANYGRPAQQMRTLYFCRDFNLLSSSSFFYSSPNLSGRRLDVYHTSTHGAALVQI